VRSTEVTHLRQDFAPHNVEAEQQLLGALLLSGEYAGGALSEAMHAGGVDLFHDPVHAEIFATIVAKDKAGQLVSPVTMADHFRNHDGMAGLGGVKYLVRLAGAAISPAAASSYVAMLADLRRKRDLIEVMNAAQAAIARGEDGADLISARMEASLSGLQPVGANRPVSMLAASTEALEAAHNAYRGEDNGGIKSCLPSLDAIVPGFFPGELILLGGRPSMGKTAVALSFALNAARNGHGVCIASLEMTPDAMAMRAISEATANDGTGVSYSQMRTGDMTEAQMRALVRAQEKVGILPVHFLPPSYRDIGALIAGVRQVKAKLRGNLRLVVVDYLQLIRGQGRSRYEEITEMLALSQLSRAVEQRDDKRPIMSDLRESGQLEQDADTILFCYRDEYYLERERPEMDDLEAYRAWQDAMDKAKNRLEVIVAKQRQGQIGTAHMKFNAATNVIWEDGWRA
jgi:replicative DNA helicase